jgi:hypothetical protein
MEAYIQTKSAKADGTFDSYLTIRVPARETTTPWKGRTLTGYGRALPTPYMVKWRRHWYRVKCICFGNSNTLYIGKTYDQCLTVFDIVR